MKEDRLYYVYITTNHAKRPLYTGVTNDLLRRVQEHKDKVNEGFTKQYNCTRLVYYEESNDVNSAIEREKQLKNWSRIKKIKLIEAMNPGRKDLFEKLMEW